MIYRNYNSNLRIRFHRLSLPLPRSVFDLSREKLRGLSVEDLRQAIEEELEQERTDEQESNDITWALVEQMMTTHGWVPMGVSVTQIDMRGIRLAH